MFWVFLSFFLQIMCRCHTPLEQGVKNKISNFCNVVPEQVVYHPCSVLTHSLSGLYCVWYFIAKSCLGSLIQDTETEVDTDAVYLYFCRRM